MGAEAECRVWWNQQTSIGKALLESEEVIFRGTFRLKIPLKSLAAAEARNGQLQLVWDGESAVFELGAAAEKWLTRIRNPKSLLDKLGVKAGATVAVDGVEDPSFLDKLAQREVKIAKRNAPLLFYGLDSPKRLPHLEKLLATLAAGTAVWTVFPKGVKTITEADVRTLARGQGWKDTKVTAFSSTHTALRWHKSANPGS